MIILTAFIVITYYAWSFADDNQDLIDTYCPPNPETQFRYDYTYSEKAAGYFKLHDAPTKWEHARKICRLEGTEVAAPETDNIKAVMLEIMAKNNVGEVHTGWNSRFLPGDFVSVKGTHFGLINYTFQEKEPARNCELYTSLSMNKNESLAIRNFDTQFPFLCYKPYAITLSRNKCSTADKRYNYTFDNHCYKFHHVPQKWEDAVAICMGEGGYLSIVNSELESKFLSKAHKSYTVWGKVIDTNFQFSGFREDINSSEWLSIFDQTLDEIGYAVWLDGYPKRLYTKNNCGAFSSLENTLGILDYDCQRRLPFFCEKIPK